MPSDYYNKYLNGEYVGPIGQKLNKMLLDNGIFFNANNTNGNIKATAWLTDIDYWKIFKDSSGTALFAIGGPTIELFINSYNSSIDYNREKYDNTIEQLELIVGTFGYSIKGNLPNDGILSSHSNGIYYKGFGKAIWGASPKNGSAPNHFGIANTLLNRNVTSSSLSIRPIVCVPSSYINENTLLSE